MPFYSYYCLYCDHALDLFHGMTETKNGSECPMCHHESLEKLVPTSINVQQETQVGNLVKEFIKENKEVAKREKEKLSKQVYKK